MSKVYVLTFDPYSERLGGFVRPGLLDLLERSREILDYHAGLPSTMMVVVTDLDAMSLRDLLRTAVSVFFLTRVDKMRLDEDWSAWILPATWEFIAKVAPQAAGRNSLPAEQPGSSAPEADGTIPTSKAG